MRRPFRTLRFAVAATAEDMLEVASASVRLRAADRRVARRAPEEGPHEGRHERSAGRQVILAPVAHLERYAAVHPRSARAAAFIRQTAWRPSPLGDIRSTATSWHVSIDHKDGRGRDGARLEAHRRYFDGQVTLSGHEGYSGGARSPDALARRGEFSTEHDIAFVDDPPEVWAPVPAGSVRRVLPGGRACAPRRISVRSGRRIVTGPAS